MHPAHTRALVLRAYHAGFSAAHIQQLTGVPPRSQRRIFQEEIPFGMNDQKLRATRGVGRPSTLKEPFPEIISAILASEPQIQVSELLRRLRSDHGYTAGKNPVYTYVRAHRPKAPAPLPTVRFEGVPGEFAQLDFGSLAVPYTEAAEEKLTFFAGRLKYSRALHVSLVPGETAEAFIQGLEAAGAAWGGLPLFNVVDNAKASVLRREKDPASGKERIHLNPHFASFLREVGVFAEPTFPYSGNQKGSVENLVKFVKHSFLLARRFRNREDLERQLAEWLHFVNQERPCDATGVIPAVRLQEERPRLRALPFGERGYGLVFPAVVGPDARVRRDGCAYSTSPRWIGQAITLRLHREHVVLHHDGQQIVHPRVPANGRYSLLPEHRAPLFVKPRGAIMAKRQILMDLCPEGQRFFTELVHRRPDTGREQDLPTAWALFEKLGEVGMAAALRYCVGQSAFGGEYLRAFDQGLVAGAAA